MTRRRWLAGLLPTAAAAKLSPRPDTKDMARRIFQRANEVRAVCGAPPLEWSPVLAGCAAMQCQRKMALGFSGHVDPELGGIDQRLDRMGIRWTRCAENLFEMRGYDDPTNFAIVYWWYSPGHKSSMISPSYTSTGVAVEIDDEDRFYVTQVFVENSRSLTQR